MQKTLALEPKYSEYTLGGRLEPVFNDPFFKLLHTAHHICGVTWIGCREEEKQQN